MTPIGRSLADRRLVGWVFASFMCLYLLTSGGHFYASDDVQKFLALDHFMRDGSVAFPEGWTLGKGGLHYSWFPLGASVLMLPGYAIGHVITAAFPWLPVDFVVRFCITLEGAVTSAALVALVVANARLLGYRAAASVFAGAALGLGTMVWPYAKTAWSEPGAVGCLFAGFYLLQRLARSDLVAVGWRLPLLAGACLAAAVSIRLELAITLPGALAWLAWQQRARPLPLARALVVMGLPLAAAVMAALAYNVARYGGLSSFENFRIVQGNLGVSLAERPRFAFENFMHYTFNPGDGAFWYSPAIVLGLWGARRFYREQRAAAALFLAGLVPPFVFLTCVWGLSDWAWGQRYSYLFLPFLIVPAAALWDATGARRSLLLAGLALGIAVQLVALPHNFNFLFERERAAHPGLSVQAMMATPAHAPLLQALKATPATWAGGLAALTAPRSAVALPLERYRVQAQFVPDVWGFLLLLSPLPRWAIGACAAALALALAASVRQLGRAIAACAAPEEPAPGA